MAAGGECQGKQDKQHWNKAGSRLWARKSGGGLFFTLQVRVPHPHVTGSSSVFSVTQEAEAVGQGILGQVPWGRTGGHRHGTATLVHTTTGEARIC